MSTPPNVNLDPGAPFSQEAEEAVIGSILIDPSAFVSIAAFLKSDDFFLLRHQYIWQGFERLNQRADPIDMITLAEELENMQVLENIGGRAYLVQLLNNTGTSVYAEVYGRLVERTSIRRKLMITAEEIKKLAMDEALNIDAVVSEAESKLFTVTETQVQRDFVPMWDALSAYYDRMEYMLQNSSEAAGVPTGYRDLDALLGGFQKSDLLIFAGRPGMGKCTRYDSLIHTTDGTVTIEALKPENVVGEIDDEGGIYYPLEIDVLTPEGVQTTSHFYDAGRKPCLKITTRAGYQNSGTYNHQLLVLNKRGEKVWKRLEDIQVGDYVAVQRHEALWGNQSKLPKSTYEPDNWRNTHRPNIPGKLTPDFAYYLGMLIGDGCLTNNNYVKFSSADNELVDLFYFWGHQLGLHPRHDNNDDYSMDRSVFNKWLAQIGVAGYAHEKSIPDVIMKAPEDCVQAFLQGLFDTDGHAESQGGYIQYMTTSEKLARQIQIVLLQFGIISKLSHKENDYRGAWGIRITGDNAREFYARVGFRLERKQERQNLLPDNSNGNIDVVPHLSERLSTIPKTEKSNLYRYVNGKQKPSYQTLGKIAEYAPEAVHLLEPEFYWDEITSVEDDGIQQCYDLVVPEAHSYIANGIVSHNTSWLLTTAMNVARFGGRVAIFTMEMGVEQMVQRMMAMETGINVQKLRLARLNPQEAARFTEAVGRISNHRIFIDDSPAISPMEMRTKCRRLKHEFGLDLVIVDYMQLMNAGGNYENNRVQEISYISRNLKELARELNVPLISAAQLSRAVEQRQDKRPVLSDLRESGCLTGDSLVYLPDCGYSVPIAELMGQTGFRVMSINTDTWKAEPAIVTNSFCTGVKPVFKMTTALGRSIRATGNHKFLTIDGWKRLDELTSDDHIAVPRSLPDQPQQTMSDAELALLGHMIGDGCVLPRHAIQYTTVEKDLAETVANLAKELFGDEVDPRITKETGRNWYQVFIPTTRHITHGVRNPLSEWMDDLGIFGLRSYEKSIPQKVFQQPNKAIALFLRHLWSTDGCVKTTRKGNIQYPAVYYATSSNQLADDVQSLLLRFEINAPIRTIPQKRGRDQYHVVVTGNDDLTKFIDEIQAVGEYKKSDLAIIRDYVEAARNSSKRDYIPHQVWNKYIVPAMTNYDYPLGTFCELIRGRRYVKRTIVTKNLGRKHVLKASVLLDSKKLHDLASSDVYWDQIVSIEPDGEEAVYDLTVEPNHCFYSANILVSNSIEQDADIVMFLYRDEVYNDATEFPNQADVIVSKHRNGPTGVVSLYFEKSLTKFMDASVHRVDLSDLE